MTECAQALRLAMLPVPRTCARCGLGPCDYGPDNQTIKTNKTDLTNVNDHEREDVLEAHIEKLETKLEKAIAVFMAMGWSEEEARKMLDDTLRDLPQKGNA